MTRADVIAKMFQPPVRNWIIERALEQTYPEWLNEEEEWFGRRGALLKASNVLDQSFNWELSKEGDQFWRSIFDKLRAEGR